MNDDGGGIAPTRRRGMDGAGDNSRRHRSNAGRENARGKAAADAPPGGKREGERMSDGARIAHTQP